MNIPTIVPLGQQPIPEYNPVDRLIELYNESDERPYVVPESMRMLLSYRSHVLSVGQLLDDGYDLDLSYYHHIIENAIRKNDYEVVEKLYRGYPPTMQLTVSIERTLPRITKLLVNEFDNVHVIATIDSNYLDIPNIMNIVNNIIIINIVCNIEIIDSTDILRQYLKLLRLSVNLTLPYEDDDEYSFHHRNLTITSNLLGADIESMNHSNQEQLLSQSINQGNYGLARNILDVMDRSNLNPNLHASGLIGLKCMIDLSEDYPELIEYREGGLLDNKLIVLVLELINIDYYLQYCINPNFDKYWEMLKSYQQLIYENITPSYHPYVEITNPNAMKTLRGQVPNCHNIIEELTSGKYNEETLLKWCMNVIPASNEIEYEDGLYLISLLGMSNDNYGLMIDNLVMKILISMHQYRLLDLRSYRDNHPYIEFLADRLPVNRYMRTKNAANRDTAAS